MTQTTEQTTQRIMDPETFNALVKQHVDLVYSAAYRQLRDPAQAQDATQAVFILLHRKAPHLDGPIAGWLLKATWYVCRDAKRTAARRRYHERQAMADAPEIASETKSDSMWDVYAPYLDEALTRLKTIDREAITLKFFQNKTNREVGEALALTEEAARKRIDRALARLHEILSAKAAVPAAVALGAVLAANAVQAAPAGVSAAVLAGTSGVSAAGTSATLLAKSAAKAMAWAKIKVAAIVACVCTATVAITTPVILSQVPPAIPPAPVAPAAPPVPAGLPVLVDPDPADLAAPGKVQVVRWDVILNPDVSTEVLQQAQAMQSASKGYDAFLINASALKKAIVARGYEAASNRMQFSERKNQWMARHALQLDWTYPSLSFNYPTNDGRSRMEISGWSSGNKVEDLTRLENNQVGITLNFSDIRVSIHEPGQPWRGDRQSRSIVYDGRIRAGQALVFRATYTADSDNDYDQLVVWEAFKMPDLLMDSASNQHSAEYWITQGINPLRQQAMNSLVWQKDTARDLPHDSNFTFQLSDGKKVTLIALARQDLWPNVWWDPNGKPIRSVLHEYLEGQPKPALSVMLEITGSRNEIALHDPTQAELRPSGESLFQQSDYTTLAADTHEILAGVPVGPWREIAQLKVGHPVTIQGATYQIKDPHGFDSDGFGISFDREGRLDDLDQLFPITADGKTPRSYQRNYITYGNPIRKIHEYPNYNGIPLQQIVSYSLRSRKREYVTFKNYALLPVQQPNTQVTYDEFVRYEIEQRRKQGRERYQSRVYEQQVGLINLFAPRSYPAGSVADRCWSAIQCARRNDEASMLKLFVMDSPEAQRDARIVAQYIMACDRFYMVAQKTYTPQAVYEECESIRHTDLYINMIRTGYYAPKPELAIVDGMFAFRTSDQKNWNFSTADMNPEDLAEMKRAAPVLFELAEQIGQRKISLSQAAAKLIELDE